MRIGIDARFYGPIGKGLGRYTQKLIENLEKIDNVNQYFIFLKKENFNKYNPKNKNFQKVLADFHWYTFAEQIKFPRLLKKYKLDLAHFCHFNVPLFYFGKFIVTIHDLILISYPTARTSTLRPWLYRIKFLAYKIVINSAILRSNWIITVSKFTKEDILKHYSRVPQEKIIVTYEACDEFCMLSPNKDEVILKRYGIIKPYVIYVGNVYPHKNPENLVLAFNILKNKHLKLVFIGGQDYFYRRLKEFVAEHKVKNVIFAGYLPDYDLDIALHNAAVYIRPSFYEGFELPPLEAMAKGVPVISSRHSCALEILEDSALYFEPNDSRDIARAIEKVVNDEKLRQELIKKGYNQVAKYSWKRMAKKTLNLYEKANGG